MFIFKISASKDDLLKITEEIRIDASLQLISTKTHPMNGQRILKWSQLKAAVSELMSSADENFDELTMFNSAVSTLKLVNAETVFPEKKEAFSIIVDLLNGLTTMHAKRRRYSLASKMFFLFLKNISPASYEYTSSVFALPHERTLRTLTAVLNVGDLEQYLTRIASVLSPRERWVSISVDGISVTPKVQLKNGEIHGQDENGEVATQMIGFMANSAFGHQVKEMLHLQECASMSGLKQAEMVRLFYSFDSPP